MMKKEIGNVRKRVMCVNVGQVEIQGHNFTIAF